MFTTINRWFLAGMAILLIIALAKLSAPVVASAATTENPTSNSCLSCHEDLYYLHDTGKNYCITEHKNRCVNCHEGNADVMDKGQAHLGLIVHPQENDGAKCRECHADDAQARMDTFTSGCGGLSTPIKADVYVPSNEMESGFPDVSDVNLISGNWPFLIGGVVVFGLWLVLVLSSPQRP